MYNDDQNNMYRNLYQGNQSSGDDYFRNFTPSTPPIYEKKTVKKKHTGAKVVALALSCALLGGAAGVGSSWMMSRNNQAQDADGSSRTSIQVSDRNTQAVTVKAVDGKSTMTEAEVYAANVNSVVSINVTGDSTNVFGQKVESASSGSGFILTTDGYIITNYHVIEGGRTVKVTLYNGDTYDAKIIGGDKDYDIAVIKIDGGEFQAVTLGDSSLLNVGDHISAIGNPLGELTFSMSEGIASSVNRAINVDGTPFNMIQVTCAVNPGNSGGPLFNQYGEVVGIVSAKYSTYSTTTVEGLGFAIPINDVLSMIEDIMTNGYVANKPYLGINAGSMTEQMALQYQYDIKSGVFVYSVENNSAAAKAGLRMGDVITKVDDTEIKTLEDLNAAKKKYSAGDSATLTIYRNGGTTTTKLTWGSVPEEQQTLTSEDESTETPQNGGQNPYGGQYGYGYGFPYNNFFDYFFGGNYGN